MITTYTDVFKAYGVDIAQRDDVQPTAEGLRAAAKVLEEKAKELDKPKLSKAQLEALNHAEKYSVDIIFNPLFSNEYRVVDEDATREKGVVQYTTNGYQRADVMHRNAVHDCGGINYRIMTDQWGDLEVVIQWPL